MPEMLKTTSMVMGAGLGMDVACVTDGRFSGGTHGFTVGHVVPVRARFLASSRRRHLLTDSGSFSWASKSLWSNRRLSREATSRSYKTET